MANVLVRAGAASVAALASALLCFAATSASARTDRLVCDHCNVILISFDTVRSDHLGAYGYPKPTSPNVDELAKKSLVFERAISQAPWTLPAHAGMLSGLYPSRLGVLRYPANRVLSDENTVLPEVFKANGYATAGFTGGGFVSEHYGFDRGFDVYESSGRRYEHNLDATLDWLDKHKEKPFFLFFHGYDAHRPYYSKKVDKAAMGFEADAADEQSRYCLRDDREKPDDQRLARIIQYYDAAIHHGDRGIGVLLKALEEMNLMDNTVILLTSDHGEEFFEHGNCDHVRFLYRESLQVPFMIYVPGQLGRRIPGLIPASVAVSRTLLDLVGIDHGMPGVTLVPMIEGRQKQFPVVYSEADSPPGILGSRGKTLAMTKVDQKLISYLDEGNDEAYDLKVDPGEQSPLPERHVAYFMRQTLRAWQSSLRPLPKPKDAPEIEPILDEEELATGVPSDAASSSSKKDGGASKKGGKKKGGIPEELKEELKSLGYLQ